MRLLAISALVIGGNAYAPPALAWGDYGHITACEIAYRNMTQPTRDEVKRLLALDGQFKSFNWSCTYPDHPRRRAGDHFLNLPRSQTAVTGPGCGSAATCAVTAIDADLAILRSTSATDQQKATALKFIGHWVGDVHQPLHVSFRDDKGGNDVHRSGRCGGSRNLHSVWDTCILEERVYSMRALPQARGWSKYTKAYRAADKLTAQITDADRGAWVWTKPWQWAAESYRATLQPETEYCVRKSDGCWYSASTLEYAPGSEQRKVALTDAYLDRAGQVVELRLKQAGVRLAHELNASFDPEYRAFVAANQP